MEDVFRIFNQYYNDPAFRGFQNDLSAKVYEVLARAYKNGDNEVKIVTDMCAAIDGTKYDRLKLFSTKIHGSRSYVEFYNKTEMTSKELADMIIISVVTENKNIVFEKTAFVQNKKESGLDHWAIDLDQLYLLKNFPTFKGTKGLVKKTFSGNVIFLNHSGALGNYGFFQAPGEMILANAEIVNRVKNNSSLHLHDLLSKESIFISSQSFNCYIERDSYAYHLWHRLVREYPASIHDIGLPFLNRSGASFDIHEFIRNLTLFNIGELVADFDMVRDVNLSSFTQRLLHAAGLGRVINLNVDGDDFGDDDYIVLVAHIEIAGDTGG